MKNMLKHTASCLLALVFASACGALVARAQSRDLRVVKAVAGGVNFVSGDVKLQTPGQSGWQSLTMKDDLKSGDVVRSGSDGRAEVLLNPGSYLRLGVNSEFELTDASLDNLRLKLYKGSAVIEATGYDGMQLAITLDTPQTGLQLLRRGVYRINITPAGETEIAVQKGRAVIGKKDTPGASVLKDGQVARVGGAGGGVALAKLDKKNADALDLWSKERAKELARINRKLESRRTNTLLSAANFGRFGGSGVWVFDARFNCYTFLPFYGAWSSPYGAGYGRYYPTYPCFSCGSNNGWNNDPFGWNNPLPTANKSYNPPPMNIPSANNPMPVSRGSSDGGGVSPASPSPVGRSKP